MSDELKRDYQEKLGDKFGAIVNGVSYDWANGLVRLNEYRAQSVSVPVASPSVTVDGQSRDQTSIVTKTQLGVFLLPANVRISSA